MAEENQTVEEIILKLKTNFEQELNRNLTHFTNFVTRTGSIVRGVEKSFTDISKGVSTNMRNMFGSAIKQINSSVAESRILMSQVSQQGIRLNDLYLKTYDKLEKAQAKYRKQIQESADAIKVAKATILKGKEDPKYSEAKIAEAKVAAEKARQSLRSETAKISDRFNKELSSMALKASKSFVKSAELNLDSVKATVAGINREIKNVKKQMETQTDLSKIFKYQNVFKDMQTQHNALQKQLRDQSQLTYKAEQQMLVARSAVLKASSREAIVANAKVFRETLENQNKVRKAYVAIDREVYNYGKTLNKTENDVREMADTLRKTFSKGIGPSAVSITSRMDKAMNLLVQYAEKAGKGMNDALYKNLSQSGEVEAALGNDIRKLKEFRDQAVQLQRTGLIDVRSEISRIDEIMKRYRTFFTDYKQQQKLVQDTLGKQKEIKVDYPGLTKLKGQYVEIENEIKKLGKIQEENVFETHDQAKKLESVWDKYLAKRKQVSDKLIQLQTQLHNTEIAMSKVKNAKILAEFEKYRAELISKIKNVNSALTQTYTPPTAIRETYAKIAAAAKSTQNRIYNDWLKNNDYVKKDFKSIEKSYNDLILQADKLSRKPFLSRSAISSATDGFNQIKEKAKQYEENILKIQNEIKKLETLQKRGLGSSGIQKQTELLRSNLAAMRKHTQDLNVLSTQAQRNIDNLHKKAAKNMISGAWEMIRNFRWQVAAVIYLITRAVNAVKRVFFNIIDETMEFEKNAMSIAASVSYSMMGNVQKNYKKAYEYSKQLMVALEMEAARTILTLEDMLMLTKTFAQAGVVPETREDVRRIATIGTAIKALTEGMANAGTQMRQEIYAVIAGRQRATDQLQMMFKMIGVNIKQVIADGKKEGKSMIETLAAALQPFEEMNKMMADSYQTAVNKLKVVWSIIKRLAGAPVMERLAESFNKIADALYDAQKEVLTAFGEDAVRAVRSGLMAIYSIGESLFGIFKTMMTTLGTIMGTFYDIGASIGLWKERISTSNNVLDSFITSMKLLAGLVKIVEIVFYNMNTLVQLMWKNMKLLIGGSSDYIMMIYGVMSGQFDIVKEQFGQMKSKFSETKEAWGKAIGIPKNAMTEWEHFQKILDEIDTSANNISSEFIDLGKRFKLPHDPIELMKSLDKLAPKIAELKKASLSGPKKFKFEYETTAGGLKLQKKMVEEDIAYVKKYLEEVKGTADDVTEAQRKSLENSVAHWNDSLNDIADLNAAAKAKMDKQNADYFAKQRKQQAEMTRQANVFMLELLNRPQTRKEKTGEWYLTMRSRLNELAETNKLVGDRLEEYEQALAEGLKTRERQDAEAISTEYARFVEQVTSHSALNEFESINNEMEKIIINIQKVVDFTDEQKAALTSMVDTAKRERIEIAKTEQQYTAIGKELDVMAAKAAYMVDSFSPKEQQKGAILELRAAYMKSTLDIQQELDRINKLYKNEQGIWKDNTIAMQTYSEALQNEYREIQNTFERDLWRKQHPLWNDMIEMSKSWADGLSDSLSDLVLDFENFGASIQSLWESIVRDMVSATIKRKLIEPAMGMLGSGEPGSPTVFQKMTGAATTGAATQMAAQAGKQASALDSLISSGQPIPVYIVQTPSLENLSGKMDQTTAAITTTGDETKNAVEGGFKSNENLLAQMLSAMWAKTTASYSNIAGSIGGLFSSSGGTPTYSTDPNSYATMYGLAEGGPITEHIVGRGLKSNRIYEFGEKSKYGEYEDVIPRKKMMKGGSQQYVNLSMPINISAIDTMSGVEFIQKHQKTIETNMLRSFKNNKAIRGMVRHTR